MDGLRLELLGERHLPAVAALLDDPDVLRFTRVPEPPPADFPSQWLTRYQDARLEGSAEAFAALDDHGRFVGLALAPSIARDSGEVELGYIVAPAFRGRGAAAAMLAQLTEWAFSPAVCAQRIVLIINVDNPASERVAERCGYTREGVMRSIHLKQDIRVDASVWSRLPSDPLPGSQP